MKKLTQYKQYKSIIGLKAQLKWLHSDQVQMNSSSHLFDLIQDQIFASVVCKTYKYDHINTEKCFTNRSQALHLSTVSFFNETFDL